MKMTILLLAEVEIEDEGHTTAYAKEEIEAGRVSNLRLATTRKLLPWSSYLVPRLTINGPLMPSDDMALTKGSG